jgi:fibronectin-binding autotransporter adhesin
MKTLRSFAMALVIVAFLSLAFNAQAQTPPNQQTANGDTGVVLNQTGPANNAINGEIGGGNGNSYYAVTDPANPANASGNAATTGAATGSNTGPVISTNGTTITANGNSNSVVSALASGTGATVGVGVSVNANQSSWSGTTPDPNATTFANASEYTSGGGNGTASGSGTVGQNGAGSASGENSAQTIDVGGLNVISTFKTDGLSSGVISSTSPAATQQSSAMVSGGLNANGASLAGNPSTGTWSDAYGAGSATYYGTSPVGTSPVGTIYGAGEVSGQTNAVVMNTPNQASVSASSTVASSGQVK